MRQLAWLDFPGVLAFINSGARAHDRKWDNRNLVLSDLTAEGWVIDGAYGKQQTIKYSANRRLRPEAWISPTPGPSI
jgi:hypothetical protein